MAAGVLGINARNLLYIKPSLTKTAVRVLDNKLLTKRILAKNGLPVPKTFATITSLRDLGNLEWGKLPSSFALKPNRGFGGQGILIVFARKKEKLPSIKRVGFMRFALTFGKETREQAWIRTGGQSVSTSDLREHILNTLDGAFSLGNARDTAFFEERIKILKLFKNYSHRGIPDIRVIVYNSVPVMAQLRLPTKESDGKANLHLGAVGVGIDMGSGITTHAVHHDQSINYIPQTKHSPRGIKIPDWPEILELAVKAQRVARCNFLGADISIDRDRGPIILELNARPGLAIQLANLTPLKERLERVRGLNVESAKKGVKIARDLFGGTLEEELEGISGKKIIGAREQVIIYGTNKERYATMAKIDTGAYRTAIASIVAEKLNLTNIVKYKKVRGALGKDERPIIDITLELDKVRFRTEAFIAARDDMKHDVIVGRRDLKNFLVDPTKNILFKK